MSLNELAEIIKTCTSCPFHETRKRAAPGRGSDDATLMIIGEAPSHLEDEQGEVFLGKAGDYLNEMLAAAGVPKERVYLTNTLKCKPSGKPEDEHVRTCSSYLRREIQLINPKLIILMGRQPLAQLLLDGTGLSPDPLSQWLGNHYRRRDVFGDVRFAVSYHPSYLLKHSSPEDEELSVAVLTDAWNYTAARLEGRPVPALPVTDIYTAPPPMWQDKSLWR
jgi:DNA polymerase